MCVRNNRLIDQVEVPSKTDIPDLLIDRMIYNQRIIGDRAGNIKIRNASFDYDFLCVRKEGYISVIVKDVDYDKLNIKSVIPRLKDYIKSFSLIEEI